MLHYEKVLFSDIEFDTIKEISYILKNYKKDLMISNFSAYNYLQELIVIKCVFKIELKIFFFIIYTLWNITPISKNQHHL